MKTAAQFLMGVGLLYVGIMVLAWVASTSVGIWVFASLAALVLLTWLAMLMGAFLVTAFNYLGVLMIVPLSPFFLVYLRVRHRASH